MKKHDIKIMFRLYKQFCRFKTKRRKLHFKEILFLVKSMKTRFKNFWFLVLQDESARNQWPMARVIQVFKDNNGYVQRVKLRIRKTRNSGGNKFWKDLCQKLCCFLNRSVFDSPTRKSRKSELVQDNLVILGEPCVDAPW